MQKHLQHCWIIYLQSLEIFHRCYKFCTYIEDKRLVQCRYRDSIFSKKRALWKETIKNYWTNLLWLQYFWDLLFERYQKSLSCQNNGPGANTICSFCPDLAFIWRICQPMVCNDNIIVNFIQFHSRYVRFEQPYYSFTLWLHKNEVGSRL